MQRERNIFKSVKNEPKEKVIQFFSHIPWRNIRECYPKVAHSFIPRWHCNELSWMDTWKFYTENDKIF